MKINQDEGLLFCAWRPQVTIQLPAPLPHHVQVKLGSQFVELANSKLKGQDTVIFFVNPSAETLGSFKDKGGKRTLNIDPKCISYWLF